MTNRRGSRSTSGSGTDTGGGGAYWRLATGARGRGAGSRAWIGFGGRLRGRGRARAPARTRRVPPPRARAPEATTGEAVRTAKRIATAPSPSSASHTLHRVESSGAGAASGSAGGRNGPMPDCRARLRRLHLLYERVLGPQLGRHLGLRARRHREHQRAAESGADGDDADHRDLDRRPDRHEARELEDVRVSHPDAAVRHASGQQLRPARPVDADEAPGRPVRQRRAGARAECDGAVERAAVAGQPVADVERARRRRRVRGSDTDASTEDDAVRAKQGRT